MVHAPGNPGITFAVAGIYRVTYSVSGMEPNQFALFLNGVAIGNSIYGSGAGTQTNSGQILLTVDAADVLTLVNHTSSSAVILQTLAGGTQTNVNASVLIEYVSIIA